MKLVVTIYEETFDAALRAIGALNAADHDMVELRAERLGAIDLHTLRASTSKPIILTHRGMQVDYAPAIEAGIDLVDIEWRPDLRLDVPRDRVVLSHHDFEGMDFDVDAMRALGCAHTKVAVTPKTLDDNLRLLECIAPPHAVAAEGGGARFISVIGMGERGLYSRILGPFLGSELTFVAASQNAAPSQLSLDRALRIYGRKPRRAEHVFAIAGNPAGHSLSPTIHNPLFRERNVAAAYTIASFETFDEIAGAFERGDIRGLSITAPFKEEAFAYAQRIDAHIRSNARECLAINTLVRMRDGCIEADNTDVDGFAALIGAPKRVGIAGAGGTARAARVAAERAGAEVTIFNRSEREFAVEPLDKIRDFDGDLIIDTLPVEIELPSIRTIRASYMKNESTGLALLHAQAIRQNELFVEAIT
jgi:3-dehydroquinate dehydratase/shikimate dehydrogenase